MRKELLFGFGAAALILAAAAASRYSQSAGLIDAETGKRVVQVVIGLYLAALGNRMPKQIGALSSMALAKRSQSALRVGGWSLTVAGICQAILWTFAPVPVARVAAITVVATAVVIMFTYGVWTFATCRRAANGPAMQL